MWPSCLFFWNESGRQGLNRKDAKKNLVILRKPVAGLSDTALAKFVARASRASKLEGHGQCAGDRQFRTALAEPAFSRQRPAHGRTLVSARPLLSSGLAGDIAISADIAKQNARTLGHSAAQEIKILVLHGVLHLVGYDHECDHGAMAGKEAKLRASSGAALGLIERNGGKVSPTKGTFGPSAKGRGPRGRPRHTLARTR